MSIGTFILQPQGGLANRMRVISVCYEMCRVHNIPFRVEWKANDELGALWSDIFEEQQLFPLEDQRGWYKRSYRYKRWYKRIPDQLWAKVNNCRVITIKESDELTGEHTDEILNGLWNEWIRTIMSGTSIYITTGNWLGTVRNLSMFVPNAKIMAKVDDCAKSFSKNTYGIHVRRTDNVNAIASSPLSLFEQKIADILKTEPEARFYLATDDQETIDHLQGKFGREVIIVREKDFSRGTVSGIQDAMVDMWILSRTKKIYGSFFSSFSEMASWIGGIELEVLRK